MNKRKGSYSFKRHDIQQLNEMSRAFLDFNNTIVKKNSKTIGEIQTPNFLKNTCLFMAALGLHCCAQAFSSCSKQGLPCDTWSSHCIGFSSFGAWALDYGLCSCCTQA